MLDKTRFGKQRFGPTYQKGVGMSAEKKLHDNSKELAQILHDHDILKPGVKIFEMGSGPGRNLYYIWLLQNNVSLECNDLFMNESLKEMNSEIKSIVKFHEKDSEDMIVNNVVSDVDVFLVSDHFMHLEYEKADKIIDSIMNKWKPKYILLREVKKEFENINHPRLYHNYDKFNSCYSTLLEKTSESSLNDKPHLRNAYFIKLLQLNQ